MQNQRTSMNNKNRISTKRNQSNRSDVKKVNEKNRVSREKSGMCLYAKKCGGCDYQGISYEKQLQEKQKVVEKLLKPFGKVEPIVGMEQPLHYRHKVHAVFDCIK